MEPAPTAAVSPDTADIAFRVPGLHCRGCVETIRANLLTETGVEEVIGDADARKVAVRYRPDAVTEDRLRGMLREIGYAAAP